MFNGDKSVFQFSPKPGKFLVHGGNKSVYEVTRGLANASTTPVFAFSVSVMMYPPILIYPYKRMPSVITHRVPDNWRVGHRRTGWMTADVV